MKQVIDIGLEKYRITSGNLASEKFSGMNGAFLIPYGNIDLFCIVSDGEGWEHVSVSVLRENQELYRIPTWAEMCFVKNKFWNKNETVIQIHPPESEYVNNHQGVLHLWKQSGKKFELPNHLLVGFKESELSDEIKKILDDKKREWDEHEFIERIEKQDLIIKGKALLNLLENIDAVGTADFETWRVLAIHAWNEIFEQAKEK